MLAAVLAGAAAVLGIVSLVTARRRTVAGGEQPGRPGSSRGETTFVGAGIGVVLVCVLVLRALEYALRLTSAGIMSISGGGAGITWFATTGDSDGAGEAFTAANAVHPLTMWPGRLWVGTDVGVLQTAVGVGTVVTILAAGVLLYVAGRRVLRDRPGR